MVGDAPTELGFQSPPPCFERVCNSQSGSDIEVWAREKALQLSIY
jgi:hypothetical protein